MGEISRQAGCRDTVSFDRDSRKAPGFYIAGIGPMRPTSVIASETKLNGFTQFHTSLLPKCSGDRCESQPEYLYSHISFHQPPAKAQ